LITLIDQETGRMTVKAYVTPNGKTVALQTHRDNNSTERKTRLSAEKNQRTG